MGKRKRVADHINKGYDFIELSHDHWDRENKWTEIGYLIPMLVLPILAINLAYFFFNDMIMAHLFYQITLSMLSTMYPYITTVPLNPDILYIKHLRNIKS